MNTLRTSYFIFVFVLLLGCMRTVPWMSDRDAIKRAHESVLEHINTPSTAVFVIDSVGFWDSLLCVRGQVDAQNEFGAVVRSKYTVVFESVEPYQVYYGGMNKTRWGTLTDSLEQIELRKLIDSQSDPGDRAWLKTGEFFPDKIKGRSERDSAAAVEYLKEVLFDLDLASYDGELFDTTLVDSTHRAHLRWKPSR